MNLCMYLIINGFSNVYMFIYAEKRAELHNKLLCANLFDLIWFEEEEWRGKEDEDDEDETNGRMKWMYIFLMKRTEREREAK